jgi:hypothetical protein
VQVDQRIHGARVAEGLVDEVQPQALAEQLGKTTACCWALVLLLTMLLVSKPAFTTSG